MIYTIYNSDQRDLLVKHFITVLLKLNNSFQNTIQLPLYLQYFLHLYILMQQSPGLLSTWIHMQVAPVATVIKYSNMSTSVLHRVQHKQMGLTFKQWIWMVSNPNHYKNKPIKIYTKFYQQKNDNFQIKILILFILLLKYRLCGYSLELPRQHRLWVLVRTALARWF